jgi:hypothetical protein
MIASIMQRTQDSLFAVAILKNANVEKNLLGGWRGSRLDGRLQEGKNA